MTKDNNTTVRPMHSIPHTLLLRSRWRKFKDAMTLNVGKLMLKAHSESFNLKMLEEFEALIPEIGSYTKGEILLQLCSRAQEKGFLSLKRFYRYLVAHPEEVENLRVRLTFNGSHFFRGEGWPELKQACEKALAESGDEPFKIWCAGCSNGKEIYSALMMLLDMVPAERIAPLATDYDEEMLRRLKKPSHSNLLLKEIPEQYHRFLVPNPDSKKYGFRVSDDLRDMVQTRLHNLLLDEYPGDFDLILCRNVIKFFKEDEKQRVQKNLIDALKPGGILMVSDRLDLEGIRDPQAWGLTQIDNSCVYVKAKN